MVVHESNTQRCYLGFANGGSSSSDTAPSVVFGTAAIISRDDNSWDWRAQRSTDNTSSDDGPLHVASPWKLNAGASEDLAQQQLSRIISHAVINVVNYLMY